MASVGVNGKGSSDSQDAGSNGEMVAICDVDEKSLNKAGDKWPKAKKFCDFRKMLDEMHGQIDAVTVSTPDHCHAAAAIMAMRLGKHTFCQKPLTHTIYEARLMGKVAAENKVATMMGNQGTAGDGLRKAAATIQAGALGTVKEVHVWTNRPIWPQGGARPKEEPVPATPEVGPVAGTGAGAALGQGYHPFAWRGWWDFGTGALGDMACHTVNMPFMGLGLRDPVSVVAKTSGHNHDSYPSWSVIEFQFPATDKRAAVKLFWYDGGQRPADDVLIRSRNCRSRKKKEKKKEQAKNKGKGKGRRKVRPPRQRLPGGRRQGPALLPRRLRRAILSAGRRHPARGDLRQVSPATSPSGCGRSAAAPGQVELHRLCRPAHRNHPPGQPGRVAGPGGRAGRQEGRVGRQNPVATNAPEVADVIKMPYRTGYSL